MDVFNAVVSNLTFNVSLQIESYDVFDELKRSVGTYHSLRHQIPAKVRNELSVFHHMFK
jgi:hypothetical protein